MDLIQELTQELTMIFQKAADNINFTVEYSGSDDDYTVTASSGGKLATGKVSFAGLSRDYVSPSGYLFPKVAWLKEFSQMAWGKYLVQLGPETKRDLAAAILADYRERHPVKPLMTTEQISVRLTELEADAGQIAIDDENAKHLNRLERTRLEVALKSLAMTETEKADLDKKVQLSDWVLSGNYDNE